MRTALDRELYNHGSQRIHPGCQKVRLLICHSAPQRLLYSLVVKDFGIVTSDVLK